MVAKLRECCRDGDRVADPFVDDEVPERLVSADLLVDEPGFESYSAGGEREKLADEVELAGGCRGDRCVAGLIGDDATEEVQDVGGSGAGEHRDLLVVTSGG
jgi:hypothetical protein